MPLTCIRLGVGDGRTFQRERDDRGRRSGRSGSDLRNTLVEPIKDRLVRGLAETAIRPRLRIVLVSRAEPFWSIVEGIPKGFVV